jgi:hypothetical protein
VGPRARLAAQYELTPRVSAQTLGELDGATGGFKDEPNTDAEAGAHVDERVGAEPVNSAPLVTGHW